MANPEVTSGNNWSVFSDVDPTELDSSYPPYFGWWNQTTQDLFFIVDNTEDAAVWRKVTLT